MWLQLSNGRVELMIHPDHIKRLLAEGAVEIDDPRIPAEPEDAPEQPGQPSSEGAVEPEANTEDEKSEGHDDGSTGNDERSDPSGPAKDRRSSRRKSAV